MTAPPFLLTIPRLLALLAIGGLVACAAPVYKNTIEVKRGQTIEEKTRWLEAHMTEERLARLKAQLKERIPSITEAQLDQMGMGWNETTFQSFTGKGSSTTVTVWVGMQYDSSFRPEPIIAAATAILEQEINGPEVSATPKVAP